MKLIGMLDSPYVRRVAIALQYLDLPFQHQSLSVFRNFDLFQELNPVVKAPTLICDDGSILMDSTLILDYAEAMRGHLGKGRCLMPDRLGDRQQALRRIGLALMACEKNLLRTRAAANRQAVSALDRASDRPIAECLRRAGNRVGTAAN